MMRALAMLVVLWCCTCNGWAQSSNGMLDSKGMIRNTGTIRIHGDARLSQPLIEGWVEYAGSSASDSQLVAPIAYANLQCYGGAAKHVDTGGQDLEVREFMSTSIDATMHLPTDVRVVVRGGMQHNGRFVHPADSAVVRLAGDRPQRISGEGTIPILEVDNPSTVLLLDDAMLSVTRRVDLQQGVLDTRSAGWMLLADSAWLYRHHSATLTAPVVPSARLHLRYYGTQRTITGAELPATSNVIGNLYQDNQAGLVLHRDVTMHDTLVLRGRLFTDEVDRQHTLTLTSVVDPVFANPWAEINGTMVRTHVPLGTPLVMHSVTTTALFADAAARGAVAAIAMRVKPQTIPSGGSGTAHVHRAYQLAMLDSNARVVPDSSFVARLTLAWRTQPWSMIEVDSVVEVPVELRALQDSLVAQRYDGMEYADHGITDHPTIVDPALLGWRTATVHNVRSGGDLAIGLSSTTALAQFDVQWWLQGAMYQHAMGTEQPQAAMRTVLRQRDLLPTTSPQAYPFDRTAGLSGVAARAMPDSIVDWVVMELRSEATGGRRYYAPALLSNNGHALDPATLTPVSFRAVRTGLYHIVMHHRNHLPVMSAIRIPVQPDRVVRGVDFTRGTTVYGGAAALVPALDTTGARAWASPVGDVLRTMTIERDDWARWLDEPAETGYLLMDATLDGIVSTNDVNLIWNNRGRSSAVP